MIPSMARERHVDVSGRSTRILEGGAGRALVLLHAFPFAADMWEGQIARVPDGWRFIAPDVGGFGPGHAPVDTSQSMDDYAADVLGLLDALEVDTAVIGGLSMGGYVTLAMFRQAPQRFDGMVLADTKAPGDTDEGRAGRRAMSAQVKASGVAAVADALLPRLLGETSLRERPDVVQQAKQMMVQNSVDAVDAALHALMARPDSTPDLARIACPTLVIVGQEDRLTPSADAELLASSIRGAELVVLPRAGHLANLETPDAFSGALSAFLSRAF
jgi:pimeloyl-ACP methyl ester carboxylesterase